MKGKRIDGKGEAIKLLQNLDHLERERILKAMMQKDPSTTEFLQNNLLNFTDIRYLTVFMMNSFLKEVKPQILGLALRGMDKDFIKQVLQNIPKRMGQDILDILEGPPQRLSEVEDARKNILDVLRKKVEKGEIVIKRDDTDVYV